MSADGYRVTYKSRLSDSYTSTYRFPIDDAAAVIGEAVTPTERARARAAAYGRADQFRLAVIAAGGSAATPVPYEGF
jgi:hypothetical protein